MNYFVILLIIVALLALQRLRLPFLLWIFIWPFATYALIRFGISPNVPSSVLQIYVWLTVIGVLAYLYADPQRYDQVSSQIVNFVTDRKYTSALTSIIIVLPLLLAAKIYLNMNVEVSAATFGRTIHPAPPSEITFKGKTIKLDTADNPFRELETSNPEEFRKHVESGKVVYYRNCVYCHGDDMAGDGMFAHGLTPVPANFNSPTTIAQLQEAYLFWRIAKGAPGLPAESGPWSSSMPAWEKFLSEEEIWDVILFLYDYTGFEPRAAEEVH